MNEMVEVKRGDRAAIETLLVRAAPEREPTPMPNLAVLLDAETGDPVAAVGRYRGDMGALRRAFMAYPMSTTKRAAGIRNNSAVFGNVSRRVHMKREGCRACGGAGEAPGAHQGIVAAGEHLTNEFMELLPMVAAADRDTARDIAPGWLIPGTPWTSGVLNDTSPLPYHYDRNNLTPIWSAMVTARRNVAGGHLHIPELDLTLECRDGDVVYFPGWHFMHGVTPMRRTAPDGYRYTAVFYAVAGMADCLPPAEETTRARRNRSLREDTLLDRQIDNGLRDEAPRPGRGAEHETADLTAGLDFRLPEYRRETFLRFYQFHLRYRTHPGCVYFLMPYLRDRFGWDPEQALWFAFLNGNTQHPPTSLALHRRFPTPAHADAMLTWWATNHPNLPVDNDRQRPKQWFRRATEYYAATIGADQHGYWETQAECGFAKVWEAARAIPGFGRLSAFSYAEYLRIMGVPVDCSTLLLADRDGSKSHRNGIAKVCGRDDLDWSVDNPAFDGLYPPPVIEWLRAEAADLLAESKRRANGTDWEHDVDYFTLESALCAYKSWHRPHHLRYPNVYADMLHDRLRQSQAELPGEDLTVFWEARADCLPAHLRLEDTPADPGNVPAKAGHYLTTGQPVMMHRDWACFDNDFNRAVDAARA